MAVTSATPATPAGLQYRAALDYLFARTTGKWKLGLERMRALLDAMGRPDTALRAFHVGGTNGKGSVCATLDALLTHSGSRVGVYSSPHLVDFRERIRIAGVPVSEDTVIDWIGRRLSLIEQLHATFFEATTAMAFEIFADAGVDVAVVEVGLGGRLDATNVLDPLASAVVSIGIDHVEYLGETHEQIAWEKAGIFKPGRPAVIGESDPAIRELLARHAREVGAAPICIVAEQYPTDDIAVGGAGAVRTSGGGTWFTLSTPRERARLHTPLAGVHQATNAAVAIAMLDAVPAVPGARGLSAASVALERVRLPGRFHRHGRYIFDVAHNPDGVAVLVQTLNAVRPPAPVVAVLSVLSDKDWRGIMEQLAPVVSRFVLTAAPTAPASRAWDPQVAHAFASSRGWAAELVPDFDEALARGAALGATVLVTGSFHTVGDAMARLQASPLAG